MKWAVVKKHQSLAEKQGDAKPPVTGSGTEPVMQKIVHSLNIQEQPSSKSLLCCLHTAAKAPIIFIMKMQVATDTGQRQ
jgi:hypothetical protein